MWTSFPKLAGWWLQVFDSADDNIIYPVTAQMTSCKYYLMPPQNHPWKDCSCLWIRSSHSLPLKYNPQMSFSLLKTNARHGNTVIVAIIMSMWFFFSLIIVLIYISYFAILGLCAGEANIWLPWISVGTYLANFVHIIMRHSWFIWNHSI